jgi:hypothetical protein
VLDGTRIDRFPNPHLGAREKATLAHGGLTIDFKMCVNRDGRVYSFEPQCSLDATTRADYETRLRGTRYQPQPTNRCATRSIGFRPHPN